MVVEKLESDSKAAHFYLECSGLVRLARARQREAQAAKAKLRQAKDTIRNLQGDVDSTSTNYESQVITQINYVEAKVQSTLGFATSLRHRAQGR